MELTPLPLPHTRTAAQDSASVEFWKSTWFKSAVELNFEDWSYNHVWPFFAVFYMAGVVIARKRYA